MDLPKEETGFPDKVSLYAPPTENESQATNSAPKDGKHLIENGIITQDLIIKSNVFEDPTIRMGFVRKVFGILLVQLLFTLVVIAIFAYHQPTKDFMQDNFLLVLVAMIVNIMVLTTIVCVENVRRKHPVNLICLALYTFTMSLLLGTASSLMDSNVVISAVAITTVLVIALCIYAVQTKYDYTAAGGVILTFVIILLVLSVCGFWMPDFVDSLPITCLCTFIGCFFLICDMQSIVGGNRSEQLDPEEYVFAALTLYVDVVRIFIYILRILQKFN
ncbi:protein lifeguard 1 isoform X4 [Drosophila teissieri]|uniref:protein lifeguard 1 isoform X4 n=1 Tax=Drosophila teissieri TaxID=7243 RepID=UPI001CBA0C62|nr:protein lifeguard 1 isoform X4 [Drosophila teissieri]XP_043662192.1 protein lifeguard 1 isoform X4 [Drosophila teissieri]